MVRAKYKCIEVIKRIAWNNKDVFIYVAKMSPVMDGSEENKKFFECTPVGSLEIGQYKEDVFEVGKEYYLDLTKAN
jgi:hypothetical protein